MTERRPRKKSNLKTLDVVKRELEDTFLKPPNAFGAEWLNKLQQRWDAPTKYTDLYEMAPTQTRTIIRFTREGLEGKVTGYKEVTVPASSATAKNSTSLLRKPANRADFVRGAAGFFPFAPGGLDGVQAIADLEDEALKQAQKPGATRSSNLERVINVSSEGGLLEVPPGFSRGLDFSRRRSKVEESTAKQIEETLEAEPEDSADEDNYGGVKLTDDELEVDQDDSANEEGDVDRDVVTC